MKYEHLEDCEVSFYNAVGQGITVVFDCIGEIYQERDCDVPPYDWAGFYVESLKIENIKVFIDYSESRGFELSEESFMLHFGFERLDWLQEKAGERLMNSVLA